MSVEMREVACLTGHSAVVWHCAWSPNGQYLATCGADRSVRIWGKEGQNWVCKSTIDSAHQRTVRETCWSPDGRRIATASFDATTSVWDISDRGDVEPIATLEGHENEVKGVSWSRSGYIATCSRDKSVWIWEESEELMRGKAGGELDFDCLAVLTNHTQDVKMVQWHPQENILASCSYDDTIRLWEEDEDEWVCTHTLKSHTSTVWSVTWSPNGSLIASAGDDLSVKLWAPVAQGKVNPRTGKPAARWTNVCTNTGTHERTIYSIDWSGVNGYIATGAGDDAIRIFRATAADRSVTGGDGSEMSLECVHKHEHAHASDVNCVAWNPKHGNILASAGDDDVVRIWELSLPQM
eukprot:Rmarinus@m.14074